MRSRSGTRSGLSRRSVLRAAAIGSVSAIATPHVRGGRAAGILTLGVWDHWVPGANNALTALCSEWGAKNSVEVRIDYITGQGEKDKLTAAAEAQAGAGHDIMSHRDWNIRIHADALEPLDESSASSSNNTVQPITSPNTSARSRALGAEYPPRGEAR
jgi:hypothetical protein